MFVRHGPSGFYREPKGSILCQLVLQQQEKQIADSTSFPFLSIAEALVSWTERCT